MSELAWASTTTVVAIVCSPGGDRTAQHASHVLAGAAAAGAEPTQVDCCDGQVDEALLKVIERADALLFAAPTYRGQAAWPLKALLDHVPRSPSNGGDGDQTGDWYRQRNNCSSDKETVAGGTVRRAGGGW